MTKLDNILATLCFGIMMSVVLMSCSSEEELRTEDVLHPIAFSSVAAEEVPVTRAAATLGRDFVVYGYKNVNNAEQQVFNGYTVSYQPGSENSAEDNTHGYYYVGGNQSVKYWDFSASEYHFWGAWRNTTEGATFSGEKFNILTIPEVPLRVGEPAPEDDVLFSELYERRPVSSDVVQLSFKRPYAKVRIQFYTTDDISLPVELTGISFLPDPEASTPLVNKVYGKGNVKVTYPTTASCSGGEKEIVEVVDYKLPQDALLYENVTLTSGLGTSSNNAVTAPIDEGEGLRLSDIPGSSLKAKPKKAGEVAGKKYFYYPLPMGEMNPAFILKVYINGDKECRTAVVPAAYMQWQPNIMYTYIFKITDAGKNVEVYDVQIDPWHYGGSQEETWTNW